MNATLPTLPAKPKFPSALALQAAKEICDALAPVCDRLIVAGSLRRRKAMVGDVEILFIPKLAHQPALQQTDFLSEPVPRYKNLAEETIQRLVTSVCIIQRKNVNGSVAWGPKNKLGLHVGTNVPVDLFTTTAANWFNYLVCRTGSAENNIRISNAALAQDWEWHPYDEGFSDAKGNIIPVRSERDAFALVGLDYLEPWDR